MRCPGGEADELDDGANLASLDGLTAGDTGRALKSLAESPMLRSLELATEGSWLSC